MAAEGCYDLSTMNDLRDTNTEQRKATTEEPSNAAHKPNELSEEMMQLLSDALDDFDEPCSRVGLVQIRKRKRGAT